jgi:shikimate kinase
MTEPANERIVLIGMMGSGKTTVGRLLGERIGWRYLDNDDVVRELSGGEPAAIAADDGEDALHAFEAKALLATLAGGSRIVVGAAAWVVLDEASREALAQESGVVYLRARPETLRERIGSGRGRRSDATDLSWLEHRFQERDALYQGVARLTIDVDDGDPDAIADAIARELSPG